MKRDIRNTNRFIDLGEVCEEQEMVYLEIDKDKKWIRFEFGHTYNDPILTGMKRYDIKGYLKIPKKMWATIHKLLGELLEKEGEE